MDNAMYEKALRTKLRFETPVGNLSVEDLWHLPLRMTKGANLDTIGVALREMIQRHGPGTSLVDETRGTKELEALQLKFDIVKHIIDTKKAEEKAMEDSKVRAENKQRILEIISRKKVEGLESMSIEELQKLAENA